MTGINLKLLRVRAGVKASVLAEKIGVSPARVTQIEKTGELTERCSDRYIQALNEVSFAKPRPATLADDGRGC